MAAKPLDKQIVAACRGIELDWGHARHMADQAQRLFDDARHVHGLTRTARPLVEATALLHELALQPGEPGPKIEKILAKTDLSQSQQHIANQACRLAPPSSDLTSLVRSLAAQPDDTRAQIAARIAAIVRISAGLDHSRTQSTTLAAVEDTGREIRLVAAGRSAGADASSAQARCNLWNDLLLRPVQVVHAGDGEIPSRYVPVIAPGQSIAEAVRRVLQRQVEQLWSRQYGLAFDEDPEYIHEMRVATRRIRTALQAVRDALGPQGDYWREEFGWLGKALGDVRDADVMLERLAQWRDEAPKTHAAALDGLIAAERKARKAAMGRLLKAVDSPRYDKLRNGFGRAVQNPIGSLEGLQAVGPRAGEPVAVAAARALTARLDELSAVPGDLAELNAEQLHEVRIACKRLRYSIEFFADILGDALTPLREACERMQELLGQVHDIDVWLARVEAHAGRHKDDKAMARAIKALRSSLAQQRQDQLKAAAALWKASFRRSDLTQARQAVETLQART